MKPSLLIALCLFVFGAQATNDVHGHKDPNEIRLVKVAKRTLNNQYQHYLRNQPNWQNFVLENGAWYVQFNEANGKPHTAFGKPILVSGSNPEEKARYFVEHQLQGFGIPTEELELMTITSNAHFNQVFFKQAHQGKEVLAARLSVKLTLDGKVVGFGADVFSHISLEQATLSAAEAAAEAMVGLTDNVESVDGNSEVMILPIPDYTRKQTTFRPVYEATVYTFDEDRVPANYLTYVDAIDGTVWMRQNLVCHSENEPPGGVTATVTDDLSLTQPFDPETNSVLANMEITQGGNTFYTDGSGQVGGLNVGNATFRLRGLWSEVFTGGTTPSMTVSLANGANAIDWGNSATSRESSAYFHVNIVHDYMKTKFPAFTSMDNALATNVDVSGSCNAFYNGTSINFYQEGAGCSSFALIGDVVYHEYGHGINDKYYQSQGANWMNGAMGEGYADIWALGITNNPILGQGNSQSLPNDFIRRYDIDPKVYPQDLIGEVHADGEIIAGAWWDLGQNFGDLQQMIDLYAATYDALVTGFNGNEGEVFVDILVETLLVDDSPANGGDNDITNGTPNDLDIINAFDAHGITLLSNATLDHDAIEAHNDEAIEVDITVINDYAWALNDAILAYRVNNGTTWTSVPMPNIGGNVHSAEIPAQPNGTVIAYYVALENLNNTLANVQPIAADLVEPNVPYYILVGYQQNRIEDFDNFQGSDWQEGLASDNNTTGTWTIDIPIGSFSDDNVMVQTDADHTPGSGNIACAVTGNAADENAGLGENDVDGGHTTLITPSFDLSGLTNPAVSYWRYYTNSPPSGANPGADWWQVFISDNGSDWVFIENTKVSDPSWRRVAIRVADYVSITDDISLKFIASDSIHLGQDLDGGSLIEGAMDDLEFWELVGTPHPEGINETEIANLSVYPNPSNGLVRVSLELESGSNLEIDVLNVMGAVVYTESSTYLNNGKVNLSLNLVGLATGIYQLRLKTDNGQVVKRLEILK